MYEKYTQKWKYNEIKVRFWANACNAFLISRPKHMLFLFKKNRLNETFLISTQNNC